MGLDLVTGQINSQTVNYVVTYQPSHRANDNSRCYFTGKQLTFSQRYTHCRLKLASWAWFSEATVTRPRSADRKKKQKKNKAAFRTCTRDIGDELFGPFVYLK